MALKLRQGLASDRLSITPASGELIYTTDTKQLYVGDGSTAGGNSISGAIPVTINSLSDVVINSATNGQVLKFDGTNWINGTDNTGAGSTNLDGLTDVVITSATTGQILKYNGTNWINAAETGGGGSMTSFSITGDDSTTTRSITDGETINFLGGGSITVSVTGGDQILITNDERVQVGTAGSIAFYRNNASNVEGTDTGSLSFDEPTGKLFSTRLETNLIYTDSAILPIVNRSVSNPFVTLGGTIDSTEYSTKLLVQNVDFDPNLTHTVFKNVYDTQFVNAAIFARSRGTLATETAVQIGDYLGTIIMSGNDGTVQRGSTFITTQVEAVSSGYVNGSLVLGTNDNVGTPQPIIILTSKKYATFGGPITVPPQELDFSSGNITLAFDDIASNYMYSTGMSTNRDLTLPSPSSTISGLRICIINKDATWVITAKYGLTTITTVNALAVKEIYCDGTAWNVLY
jgi:hypothetical protein